MSRVRKPPFITRAGLFFLCVLILIPANGCNLRLTEPSPLATPDVFTSGGLGLSRAQWGKKHKETSTDGICVEFDNGEYAVTFIDGRAEHIERTFAGDKLTLDDARRHGKDLFPFDAQFVETYSPEALPELTVDLYMSDSLKERFDSDWFTGGEPGNFIAIYGVFDGRVPSVIIATGNNP